MDLHEAARRNLHKARRGQHLVQAHTALPDPELHNRRNDLLVDVLHQSMDLRGDAHKDHCLLHMEREVVGCLLLDSPTGMDKFTQNEKQAIKGLCVAKKSLSSERKSAEMY